MFKSTLCLPYPDGWIACWTFNKQIQREHHLPPGDFPNVDHFRDVLSGYSIDKFEKLKPKMIQAIDDMLGYDIPELLKNFRNPYEWWNLALKLKHHSFLVKKPGRETVWLTGSWDWAKSCWGLYYVVLNYRYMFGT